MFWNHKNELKPEYSWLKLPELFRNDPKLLKHFYQELFQRIKRFQSTNFYSALYEKEVFKLLDSADFYHLRNQKLFGLPFFVKDNFAVKYQKTEAGSRILQNFIPNFNATVVDLLTAKGVILVGKTNMDELGMGGTGLESNQGIVKQPYFPNRITGGSSSGSAVAVALNLVPFSLASDTGNSVRLPASFLGIIGFKPTFGAISRFGLVPYSPTLDTVSLFAVSLRILNILMETLYVLDQKDFAMQKIPFLPPKPKVNKKVAIIGLNSKITNPKIIQLFNKHVCLRLKEIRYDYEVIELDYELTSLLNFLYQVLSFPDALSSHANLTGFNFGYNHAGNSQNFDFAEIITTNRTIGLGLEIKKRYVLGAFYVEDQNRKLIYEKALKMINFLKLQWMKLFADFDFVIHPASTWIAPSQSTTMKQRLNPKFQLHIVDDFLLITNFLGWPSIVLPAFEIDKQWVGINIFSEAKNDFQLLKFAQLMYNPIWGIKDE